MPTHARPIVLVHGGWEGGWYWRPVARFLRESGREVYTPTLTGLGERSHLLTRDVTFSTHVEDIANLFRVEELSDTVLVGHSYGGAVVTAVADLMPKAVGALIYLDAYIPKSGQSILDMARPERRKQLQDLVEAKGDGYKVPPIPAADWGITDPDEAAWIDRHSGPHPFATMTQKIDLTGAWESVPNKTFVLASAYDPSPFQPIAASLRESPGWTVREIDCHHFLNVSKAKEVAELIMEAA